MSQKCKWGHNGFHFPHHEYWETGCENFYQQANTTSLWADPSSSVFKYCPYCGREIEVVEE